MNLYAFVHGEQGWLVVMSERQPCWHVDENRRPRPPLLYICMHMFSATFFGFFITLASVATADNTEISVVAELQDSSSGPQGTREEDLTHAVNYQSLPDCCELTLSPNSIRPVASPPIMGWGSFSSNSGAFQGLKIKVPSDCLAETSIFKIIMIDDLTLWSKLESTL